MDRWEEARETRVRIAPVDSDHDLISKQPRDIIEAILTKLPIKDAVRTCILSRTWRYKWTSMTRITCDDRIVSNRRNKPFSIGINRFINGFLSTHNGSIQKFKLSSKHTSRLLEVEKWLLSLSQKDVKELSIRLSHRPFIRAPSSLFSCTKLTRLKLYFCVLRPPQDFTGFLCVKNLVLYEVDITCEDMERLISGCPLLERLTLAHYGGYELTVRAPNLECLAIRGAYRDIRLEKMPLLADLTVYVRWINDMQWEKLLGGVPKLEWLYMQNYFTRPLRAGTVFGEFITYEFLEHIELPSVSFHDPKEVLTALKLIFSSPNLQEFRIKDHTLAPSDDTEDPCLDYYKDPSIANGTLNQLKLVKITGNANELVCVKLIEFLLDRSPSLVKMIIKQRRDQRISKRKTLVKLSSFPRASPTAKIVFA